LAGSGGTRTLANNRIDRTKTIYGIFLPQRRFLGIVCETHRERLRNSEPRELLTFPKGLANSAFAERREKRESQIQFKE
jgi:hypothetical protein